MANSRENYFFTGDYTVLWCHPKMPKPILWKGSHDFDLCFRVIIASMVGRKDIEVFDFDVEHNTSCTTMKIVITKIKEVRPNLIMFFDEFSQWNVTILHAIRKDKEITKRSYQIISYPTMSLVLSNFNEQKEKKW